MSKDRSQGVMETVIIRIGHLIEAMEKAQIAEYVEFLHSPKRVIWSNFIAGLARGFGIAIGATVVGALFLFILGRLVALNLPLIGEFISEIAHIVQERL